MHNILKKQYNENIFKNEFIKSNLYKKITVLYPPDTSMYRYGIVNTLSTPREEAFTVTIYLKSFYYLGFLNQENDIYDIGCGSNFFKNIIPNIIGINPEIKILNHTIDSYDFYDLNFVSGHQHYFNSVFSINALHFRSLIELKSLFINFNSMICDEGKGYLSLNVARLVEHTEHEELYKLFKNIDPTPEQLTHYIQNVIIDIGVDKFEVIDIIIDECYNEYMSGNIHLVFNKGE